MWGIRETRRRSDFLESAAGSSLLRGTPPTSPNQWGGVELLCPEVNLVGGIRRPRLRALRREAAVRALFMDVLEVLLLPIVYSVLVRVLRHNNLRQRRRNRHRRVYFE